eukprot:NODE_27_length_39007_cov_1.590650.p3 type:complete len:793 gc:universal NODE_27_length_39007_cov_1.590650:31090-33468(+)
MRHSSRTNYYEGSDSESEEAYPKRRSSRLNRNRRITLDDYEEFYSPENSPQPRKRRKILYNIRETKSKSNDFIKERYSLRNKENTIESDIVEETDPIDEADTQSRHSDKNDIIASKEEHEGSSIIDLEPNETKETEVVDLKPKRTVRLEILVDKSKENNLMEESNTLEEVVEDDEEFQEPDETSSEEYEEFDDDITSPDRPNPFYSFRRRRSQKIEDLSPVQTSYRTRRNLRKKKDFRPFTDYQSTQQVLDLIEKQSKLNKKRKKINYNRNESGDSSEEEKEEKRIMDDRLKQYDHRQTVLRDMIETQMKSRLVKFEKELNSGDSVSGEANLISPQSNQSDLETTAHEKNVTEQDPNIEETENHILVDPPLKSWSEWFRNLLLTETDPAPGIGASPGDSRYSSWYDYLARGPMAIKDRHSEPLNIKIASNISFNSIAGLDEHIVSMKEMVILPLLYPHLYTNMGINPPRGVLFTGLPGTGKTLLARTLASQYGNISFFVRKGADILSKWVGEAERQLKKLFEEARAKQPSIIFFDEIDGLSPTRSGKQDQIHSSVVATLLALMDGLESRGQVIIIGATNRPDAIDPALRRPGRFDRELYFTLPNKVARKKMLEIYTEKWTPRPSIDLLSDLSNQTIGYCGADIRALCTESALNAVRRVFPHIYQDFKKYEVDPSSVVVSRNDFILALKKVVPSLHRSSPNSIIPLNFQLEVLLYESIQFVFDAISNLLPINGIMGRKRKLVLTGPSCDLISRGVLHLFDLNVILIDPSILFGDSTRVLNTNADSGVYTYCSF